MRGRTRNRLEPLFLVGGSTSPWFAVLARACPSTPHRIEDCTGGSSGDQSYLQAQVLRPVSSPAFPAYKAGARTSAIINTDWPLTSPARTNAGPELIPAWTTWSGQKPRIAAIPAVTDICCFAYCPSAWAFTALVIWTQRAASLIRPHFARRDSV